VGPSILSTLAAIATTPAIPASVIRRNTASSVSNRLA
jgi:hypothetical protein